MSNNTIASLAKQIKENCPAGYDIYFLHGWLISVISAPNEVADEDLLPTFLMFQTAENFIENPNVVQFMQELNSFATKVMEETLSSTETIQPLVNLNNKPVDFGKLSPEEQRNLLSWVYGYLFSYLANWDNVADYCEDKEQMGEFFYAPLLHLSAIFLLLDKDYDILAEYNDDAKDDYADLKLDIYDLWEDNDGGNLLSDEKLVEFRASRNLIIADVGNVVSMLMNFVMDNCDSHTGHDTIH